MTTERQHEARRLSEQLRRVMAQRLAQGLVPHGGRWLDAASVDRELQRERRRARVVLVEVLLLLLVLGFLSYFIVALIQTLAY